MDVARDPDDVGRGLSCASPSSSAFSALAALLRAGGTYANPAVSRNCSKNPHTPSPTSNTHSPRVAGSCTDTDGSTSMATSDPSVVTVANHVTETSGCARWPITRMVVYAQLAPATPTNPMPMARMCCVSSRPAPSSFPDAGGRVASPNGRAISTTPASDTTAASCCRRVNTSFGSTNEHA
ncbi:conserved hypothetical protein [Aspergillus terreus NIH2624]|uniref:Uncharacterized protein n=1 Tax=Aspergillus terreus (strain NIH 2624 / FGSC A1156) TaxID=341663 RepID=Q0CCM7_ASPTN|nr:uncharacterized protein ATEG_08557 [Aspergillus terreus NIH2624]EAU30689.1 conserved hypothetical protein [Aspergillus terreus NIH2624]